MTQQDLLLFTIVVTTLFLLVVAAMIYGFVRWSKSEASARKRDLDDSVNAALRARKQRRQEIKGE